MAARTPGPEDPDAAVMDWLRQGIPLTLLLDLVDPTGPRSGELYEQESGVA